MVDSPNDKPRKDTRGLPEGYDPLMFYEYNISTNAQTTAGIESFAYKYIPWKYLRSFAFAIDPLGPFKVAPFSITPYNRLRKQALDSVLLQRKRRFVNYFEAHSHTSNYENVQICWSPKSAEPTVQTTSTVNLDPQSPVVSFMDDTTSRTRLLGSKQGTMRFFKSYINSPARRAWKTLKSVQIDDYGPNPSCSAVGGTTNLNTDSTAIYSYYFEPTAAVLYPWQIEALRDMEYAYLENLISKNAVSMLKDWSPHKRSSTLFRNIVELRDIPRSVASLQGTLINLRSLYTSMSKGRLRDIVFDLKKTANDIPNEYLSYHFGWKQTYKDVMELLALPTTLSKKYDFLIKRAGKPTTFRLKREFLSGLSDGLPGSFDYDKAPFPTEYDFQTETVLTRKTELRLVINSTFDFPPPNLISFRSHDVLDRMGLVPRPTDLYNLTPWTWLIDWFTGLGSYVELIDNMARDTSLVNWGMITGKTTGTFATSLSSKTDDESVTSGNAVPFSRVYTTRKMVHTSKLEYECQIRKDVANAFDVKTIAGLNLSAYQLSILGALLAQRKDKFIPRS